MEKKIFVTEDGSHSISIPDLNVNYHSIHGAIQESMHVFIDAGLRHLLNNPAYRQISVFEMGFGTGLNAFLTAIEAKEKRIKIHYTTVEPFPLSIDEAESLNYAEFLHHEDLFQKIQECEWNKDISISEWFLLRKEKIALLSFSASQSFNLIYYDAFAPNAQPELWTKETFEKLFQMLQPGGALVTYCSKGDVRRAMAAAGFHIKKLPGPPGKREMIRAVKS